MTNMLTIEKLQAFYGPSQALFDVSLAVQEGKVVALMGRNGMGKSTTMKAICRMLPHGGGTLQFEGRDITTLPSHRVAGLGIGLVPEGRRCFPTLTVFENCRAVETKGPWNFARACELFPRLAERKTQLASTLSGGEQQMLAIARALVTNPRLLLLDEATEGLAPTIRHEIWAAIGQLKRDGQSILLVDKSFNEVLKIADQCVVLEKGVTVWSGSPNELTEDLRDRYIGV